MQVTSGGLTSRLYTTACAHVCIWVLGVAWLRWIQDDLHKHSDRICHPSTAIWDTSTLGHARITAGDGSMCGGTLQMNRS